MDTDLFFIGLTFPKHIAHEIHQLKLFAAANFKCKHALRSIAHITIIPPFNADYKSINHIVSRLKEISRNSNNLLIKCRGFNFFEKRTIYIAVEQTKELNDIFFIINDQVNQVVLLKKPSYSFIPHITVANKDIKLNDFDNLFYQYEKMTYHKNIIGQEISLFKQLNNNWHIYEAFRFKPDSTIPNFN